MWNSPACNYATGTYCIRNYQPKNIKPKIIFFCFFVTRYTPCIAVTVKNNQYTYLDLLELRYFQNRRF